MLIADVGGQFGEELIEMSVDRGVSIGMVDIDRLAKAAGFDGNPGHIAIRRGEDGKVLPVLCPDIEAHVIMVGAKLAKVGGETDGDGQWVTEVTAGNFCRGKNLGETLKRTTTTEREDEIPHDIKPGLKIQEATKIPNHRLVIPIASPIFPI